MMSDKELDELLNSVSASVQNLKKCDTAKISDMKKDGDKPEEIPAAAPEAPGAEAPAPEAPAPEAEAPAAEGSEQPPEAQAPQGEGEELSGDISDEELQQIYGAMPPEELEKHYMIIRSLLMQQYGAQDQAQGAAPAPGAEAPAQAPGQPPMAPTAPAAPAAEPPMPPEQDMGKSEMKKMEERLEALSVQNADLRKAVEGAVKAVELTLPRRRGVASMSEIGIIEKSEAEVVQMSDDDMNKAVKELTKRPDLTKGERETINSY
jgi:hypothetical protein